MLELIVERWSDFGGIVDYRWSLWQDGRRIQMGGSQASAAESEAEGRTICRTALGRDPDRVTLL